MSKTSEILVINTSKPANAKIIRHIKPVTSSVVIGTNVVSDIISDFTSFFGGRSNTYQNKLSNIYETAIEELKIKTHDIGGNCIVGLKIDIDEITGGRKTMFMITAIGTASKIKLNDNQKKYNATTSKSSVTISDLEIQIKRSELIRKANENDLTVNNELWKFAIEHRVYELFDCLYSKYISNKYEYQNSNSNFDVYVSNLDSDFVKSVIYRKLTRKTEEADGLISIIKKNHLFDFKRVSDLLNSSISEVKQAGLNISMLDKHEYKVTDIECFKKLNDLIDQNFPVIVKYSTKNLSFSSKKIKFWICSKCGKENNIETSPRNCYNCRTDIYGLRLPHGNTSVIESKMEIKKKIDSLKKSLINKVEELCSINFESY
ncbi:MAG: heavy metal-binding domain-containing protein [Flavobacteriaceae bacterium]|nr:heavy metal-binding domain-containing protein [Flavobacteriaceae bacterium]